MLVSGTNIVVLFVLLESSRQCSLYYYYYYYYYYSEWTLRALRFIFITRALYFTEYNV